MKLQLPSWLVTALLFAASAIWFLGLCYYNPYFAVACALFSALALLSACYTSSNT